MVLRLPASTLLMEILPLSLSHLRGSPKEPTAPAEMICPMWHFCSQSKPGASGYRFPWGQLPARNATMGGEEEAVSMHVTGEGRRTGDGTETAWLGSRVDTLAERPRLPWPPHLPNPVCTDLIGEGRH